MHTFVAIYKCVLDDNTSSVESCKLLRLPSHITQVGTSILGTPNRAGARNAQDMAGKEILSSEDFIEGSAALGLAEGQEHIRRWDKEDVLVDRGTLSCEGALKEGRQEGV